MKKKKRDDRVLWNIFLGLAVVLVILYGINILATYKIVSPLRTSAESQRPANLHLTLITNDCKNCFNMGNVISFIKNQNVKIIREKNLSYTDREAQDLISKNNINSLPALIITGETFQPNIATLWQSLGVQPVNDVVVFSGIPPYYSLVENKVVGLVQVIMLTDNSCSECYDVETHMLILPRFGIYVDKSIPYDISSSNGKELLQKYNITKVPTILLSPDAFAYVSLNSIWDQVGTVESDGWYVFRSIEQMGNYKDLSQNKIINVTG